ncbi:hypothetical protein KR032_002018, partial [Drosophila birchii]
SSAPHPPPTMSTATTVADPSSSSSDAMSRNQKRQEKRKQRRQNIQHIMYTKHFSNCRLPVMVKSSSDEQLQRLSQFGSLTSPPSDRRSKLFVISPSKSPWDRFRLVPCPIQGCHCSQDPSALLSHYLSDHLPGLGIPFVQLVMGKRVSLSCHVSSLESDVHTLLGVFGYRRTGLNPLKCPRNTNLPAEYRQFSQHGVLLVFACRTQHSMLWQTKEGTKHDVLAIWASTPLQNVDISLRLLVQPANSARYYTREVRARPIQSWSARQSCGEFIRTDSNVILISFEDLRPLMDLDVPQQLLTVELKVVGEARI